MRNGGWQVFWWCAGCERRTDSRNIPHRKVANLEALPVVWDYTGDPCERCGRTDGVEAHHWAPRHVFGPDADSWPMSDLCAACHKEWHEKMTPSMGERRGEYRKWLESDPNEGMAVSDLEAWESEEYAKWCEEQDRKRGAA